MGEKIEKGLALLTRALYVITGVIYTYLSAFGALSEITQRCLLVTLLCPTIFVSRPLKIKGRTYVFTRALDLLLAAAVVCACAYLITVWPARSSRTSPSTTLDIIMGTILLVCVFEMTRRVTGKAIMIVAGVFILYAVFGRHIPGVFMHAGFSWHRIISFLYTTTEGFFGTPIGIASTYIVMFVTFASFLDAFGTGEWFVDLAYSIAGRFRGGPAKTAVAASGLMGMISGSAVSNVVTTGSFTIPLMKRVGYPPHIAGAVEAVASSGGIFTPPIMGAAAFIMADYVSLPYAQVAKAAAFPAFLYYFSIMFSVDAVAVKRKLSGLPRDELPNLFRVIRERGVFIIPIAVLIGLIARGYSPLKSSFFSIVAVLIVACFRKGNRPTVKKVVAALEGGGKSTVNITATCIAAGVIVGMVNLTGVSQKLSYNMILLAHGNMYIGAVLVAVIAIILGCGMPPSAVYILSATVMAPPLISMGAYPLAAHMFIFMFSCIGAITPPVAVTAYTAAAIAKANPNLTGYTAFRFGLVAYIVPFIFISSPALLLIGAPMEVFQAVFTALIGVMCLVGAVEGYLFIKVHATSRVLLGIAALLTIIPGFRTDLIGIGLIVLAVIIQWAAKPKKPVKV